MGRSVLVLREQEIRELLDPAACIEAVERAFSAYATGKAELPAVIHLDVPDHRGEIHIKAGYLHGGSVYAVKMASGFPGNAERGLPPSDGMVLAFDAVTGAPAALLLDNGFITEQRTGAAGAVAARHLSRSDARVVGVVGCGNQARYQLLSLALVRPFAEARIYGRRPGKARACAETLAAGPGLPPGCRVRPVATAREAVEGADIVITVTPSREPIVRADWLRPGMHVTAVGSDGPDKQEVEAAALAKVDRLVADSRAQCLRLGEIHHAVAAGIIPETRIDAELGDITAGRKPGRTSATQITFCDLTGVGVQDVAAAAVVLERAARSGRGERLAL